MILGVGSDLTDIRRIERAIERFGAPVYVRHEIVHNRYVVDKFSRQGVTFVEQLSEVDTEGVKPLIYLCEDPLRLRPDVAGDELSQEQALKNAPSKDSDYFKVPKVIDNSKS